MVTNIKVGDRVRIKIHDPQRWAREASETFDGVVGVVEKERFKRDGSHQDWVVKFDDLVLEPGRARFRLKAFGFHALDLKKVIEDRHA